MTKPVISVENLSKAYRIGLKDDVPDTITGALTGWIKAPLKNFKRLRRLNTFHESGRRKAESGDSDESQLSTLDSQPENDTLWALKAVSFEVNEGEVVGIVGRNGAGKSTLLKVLSRITEPTFGRAIIRGRVGSLLEVGTGFHPELTGRENVYMNGTILGMRKHEIDRKFDEIVDFSGVEKFLDTPTKRYSSGMQVRLAFAVAAHLDPEILIIDEVLAVGDAEFQKKCLGKMQDVAAAGRTVLFVSHNMAAITRLCATGLVLSGGTTMFEGNAIAAVSEYLSTYCSASQNWDDRQDPPGSEIVVLRCARVLDRSGNQIESCSVQESVRVEVRYDVLVGGHVLVPNLHFYTADGTYAFVSHDHECSWHDRPKAPGQYMSFVEIPSNFLNTGWITIGVAISTYRPFMVHCHVRDALVFQITESMNDLQSRGGYAGNMPGVVRPLLPWTTRPLFGDN